MGTAVIEQWRLSVYRDIKILLVEVAGLMRDRASVVHGRWMLPDNAAAAQAHMSMLSKRWGKRETRVWSLTELD